MIQTMCCYQPGVVTNRVLLPTGCCYQPGVVTNQVVLPTGYCNPIRGFHWWCHPSPLGGWGVPTFAHLPLVIHLVLGDILMDILIISGSAHNKLQLITVYLLI